MTARALKTKRNAHIRDLAAKGYTRKQIARVVNIHPNTVKSILDAFVAEGELQEIPNTSPRIYIDPHARSIKDLSDNDGYVEIDDRGWADSLSDFPDGKLPLGWVNLHFSGSGITAEVEAVGTYADVPAPNIGYCGYWEKSKSGGKGLTSRRCCLSLFKQRLSFVYVVGTRGGTFCKFDTGRFYFDPKKISRAKAEEFHLKRAETICQLLSANGWKIVNVRRNSRTVVNRKDTSIHVAKEGDPLSKLIPADHEDDGRDINSDFSPGKMLWESELEGISDDQLVEIYANMPSSILDLRRQHALMMVVLKEQGEMITSLASNVDRLTEVTVKIVTQQTAQAQFSTKFTGEGYQ